MTKKRGFSLVEGLITIGIIGIMLLLVNLLMRDLQRESRHSRDQDRRLGAQQCIDRIGLALRSCRQVLEPVTGTRPLLRLRGWNARENENRLPLPPFTPPANWEPAAPAHLLEKRFEVSQGTLLCTQTQGGDVHVLRMLGEVEAFSATAEADGSFRLRIEWFDSKRRPQALERASQGVYR